MARASIQDIAQAAGVSHPTVSRALRGDPRISAETADRVLALAGELGYTPSAAARSLVTRRTQTVGVVVTTIADPFVSDVVDGIEAALAEHGYALVLALSRSDPERELAVVRLLSEHRVDGIIVAASRVGDRHDHDLVRLQVPVVLLNNQAEAAGSHFLEVDDVLGARLAVLHLLDLGHRRIAYVWCPDRPRSTARRLLAYPKRTQGLLPPPGLVLEQSGIGDDLSRGRAGLASLLAVTSPPTAVLCYNDLTAIGALLEARHRGLRVAADLSIVGFDDVREAALVTPSLTTVRQPRREMGRRAGAMLLAVLRGENVADEVIAPELVIRESTAPPSGRLSAKRLTGPDGSAFLGVEVSS